MLLLGVFVLVLCTYILLNYIKLLNYWKNKGAKYITPLPIVGNSLPLIHEYKGFPEFLNSLYNQFPNERCFGFYTFSQPVLMIKDLELIKDVTIRNFESFTDHARLFDRDADPLWGRNVLASEGRRWKNLRNIISPAFATGKMKFIYGVMDERVQELLDYFKQQKSDILDIELGEVIKPLVIDILASTSFGINCNSITDRNNEFIRIVKQVVDFTGLKKLKFTAYNFSPYLVKILNLHLYNDDVSNYFRTTIKDIMETRTRMNITRPDVINALMEAKYYSNKISEPDKASTGQLLDHLNTQSTFEINDEDIIAQALLIFFAGFETMVVTINFCIYELVANPQIQRKLRQEIDEHIRQYGGITYEHLGLMKYLDMVIQETLRKWPVSMFMDRKVSKPYTIEPERSDEKPIHLVPGDLCWIPIYCIHRDPRYWPNPDSFDPERFNDENRSKIHPSVFLPFGAGPRMCFGFKYAVVLIKLIISHLLSTFEIVSVEKTHMPLVLDNSNLVLTPIHGFWFGLKKRKSFIKANEEL